MDFVTISLTEKINGRDFSLGPELSCTLDAHQGEEKKIT